MVLGGRAIASVWAKPGLPVSVLAVSGGELLASRDGGRTWQPVPVEAPATAIWQTGDPPRLYVSMEGGRLTVSEDHGESWTDLPPVGRTGKARALMADPNRPGWVYALWEQSPAPNTGDGGDGGLETLVLRGSPERGEWHPVLAGLVRAIACDASTGFVYAATGVGVQVSADAGVSWLVLPGSPVNGLCMVVTPGPANKPPALLVGSPEGLHISYDGGESWLSYDLRSQLGLGLQSPAIVALTRDPQRRDRLYAATDESYLFESGNRGREWQQINAEPLPTVSCLYVIRF
jgi:hypothetical protein